MRDAVGPTTISAFHKVPHTQAAALQYNDKLHSPANIHDNEKECSPRQGEDPIVQDKR